MSYILVIVSFICLIFIIYWLVFLICFSFLLFVIVLQLFFLYFLVYYAACGLLIHGPEIRLELLWWHHQVQTTGLTETLRPHGILVGVKSLGGPHLNT